MESSLFPLPPDVLMVPMILKRREVAWKLAFWGTIFSVLGGILGYWIGYSFFHILGHKIISLYGMENSLTDFRNNFSKFGTWIIICKGLTPIPFKLVTIASGLSEFPIKKFLGASIICRGMRFFLLAALLRKFGSKFKHVIEKHINMFFILTIAIVFFGFFIVKFFK